MDPVRVASVGLGWWSGVLADAASKAGNLRIVAAASRSADKRATFAAKYGCRPLPGYEAVLADPEVEAVFLTTPHTLHAQHVIAAAEAGKHVFVEKPFALTVADARRAGEACRRAGVALAVGHQRRRFAATRALKRLVESGAFGRPIQIEGNLSSGTGFTYTPAAWRTVRDESPAGPMTSLGIHYVDTYQYLLGPIARVMAMCRQRVLTGMAIDDSAAILFEFASGALGYLGTSSVLANRLGWFALHGSEAQAWSDESGGGRLTLQKRGAAAPEPVELAPAEPVVEQLAEFARCVRENQRPEVGGEEATASVAVLEAIVESSATGRAVDVRH